MTKTQKLAAGIAGALGTAGVITLAVVNMMAGGPTYHVGPGGSDSADGLSYATRWGTITKANAAVPSGSTVYLYPGTHSGFPNPAATPTNGRYITFIGAGLNGADPIVDTLSRATVRIPGGSLSKPYVVVKGITSNGELGCSESADRCSVIACTALGSWSNQGGDYNTWVDCEYRGKTWNLNKWVLGHSDGVKLFGCDFPYLGQNMLSGDHCDLTWDADSTVEMFCRKLITVEATVTGDAATGPSWHFDDRNHVSRGNETRIRLNRACYGVWRWRADVSRQVGCYNNTFDADKIIVTGAGGRLLASSSGTCDGSPAGCVGHWDATMDSCLIDASACTSSQFEFQGGMTGWTISNSTIRMRGPAVYAFDIHNSAVTFSTLQGLDGVAVRWTDEYSRPLWGAGDMNFCQNIVQGSIYTAPSLAAVSGAVVSNCSTAPPSPSVTPLPSATPVPVDTARITVRAPAVITVVP